MRLFLVFIIVLNVLYAGWEYLSPVPEGHELPALAENLNSLELLHELDRSKEEPQISQADTAGENNAAAEEAVGDSSSLGVAIASMAEPDPEVAACFTLGPFKDENIMQQLQESLAEHVEEISVRKRQQLEKHRYWVYMPALQNRKQAKQMAKELRRNNITDFYIVLSGSKKNSISLGHFREPNHANRRVKNVVALGFEAEIEIIYREYDIYWLDYKVDKSLNGTGFSMDEYLTEGVSILDRECDKPL